MPKFILPILFVVPLSVFGQLDTLVLPYEKESHVQLELLSDQINTEQDELAPFRYAEKLYFSQLRPNNKDEMVTRIFSAIKERKVLPFAKNPRSENLHMGDGSLTVGGKRIYYTLFRMNEKGEKQRSEIWYRDKDYFGKWGPPIKLPRHVDKGEFTTEHPCGGIFREMRKEVLFFVSDLPGGKGKKDIWYCFIEKDGTIGEPVNLPINTPEDEETPYFDTQNQTLYFSSKGYDGPGGFDVFRTKRSVSGEWMEAQHLGKSVNSRYDEKYFIYHEKSRTAYFCSDRPNETCPTNTPLCRDFDIYKARLCFDLQVFIFDEIGNTPLGGCNVELIDQSNEKVETTYLNINGNYATLGLAPDRPYQLVVSKQGYYPAFIELNTEKKDLFLPIREQVFLKPMVVYGGR